MIKNYWLIVWRSMIKNKLFIFINVVGIAIAVACCIVAFLNWKFNNDWDKDHLNAHKIYRIQSWLESDGKRSRHGTAPMPLAGHIRQNISAVSKVVRFIPRMGDFRMGDQLLNTGIAYADSDFFKLFTFRMKYGNAADFGDKSKIFIEDQVARKYFDKEDVVGESLTQIIEGNPKEFIVGGVFEKLPLNNSFYSESYTHIDNYWGATNESDQEEYNWKGWNTLFLQIDNPDSLPIVTQRIQNYAELQNQAREDFRIKEFYLENFKGMADRNQVHPRLRGDWLRGGLPGEAISIPITMAVLLLLLACFNFTNTSIAISSKRVKEIGLRKVLGGVRKQLIFQFFSENMILCLIGLLLGLLLAEWLVPSYDSMWPWLELDLYYSENSGLILFLAALLIITAVIAGGYPAVYITSFEPVSILKGKQKFGGTNWFTRILLGLQFTISLLAIVFAVAFYENAAYQKNYDLGFSTSGVISVPINSEGNFNAYRHALSASKDVLNVAGAKNHITNSYYTGPVRHESIVQEVDIMEIGDNYTETMGMTVLSGRGFRKDSQTDLNESILVTEQFVKDFGWKDDPIGKRIVWMDTVQLFVIGVVKDVHARGLWQAVRPLMMRYTTPNTYQHIIVSMKPEDVQEVNGFMESKWKEVFPNSVYNGRMIDQENAQTLEVNNNIVKMCSFLGFFAVLLSVTGLYTLVSLNIIKKMKEIGVRKVLGASRANITGVINLEFVIILSIAGISGGGLGYWTANMIMDSWWEYFKPIDLITLSISVSIIFLISAIAVSYKTFTTASINPVKTLRNE